MATETKIQILRNLGTAVVAEPTLLPGELAYARGGFTTTGPDNALVIGDGSTFQVLIGANRQVETKGDQSILSGTKTFAAGAKIAIGIADLNVAGGVAGDTITTDGAGNLVWGAAAATGPAPDGTTIIDNGDGTMSVDVAGIADGVTIIDNGSGKLAVNKAVTADVAAGTADKFVDTALLKTDVLGDTLANLSTNSKLVVPAINELYGAMSALSGGIIYAGSLDASTGVITPASGVANVPASIDLVDPALTKNYFWIVTNPGANTGTADPANRQDWVVSDGTVLRVLNLGPTTVVASEVAYTAGSNTIVTGPTVQDALDQIEVALHGPIDGGVFA